ncbi:MAG: aminotransferase class III-fold pyridoxal phosphate-dependent enzyme [Rubrivivax sp.]
MENAVALSAVSALSLGALAWVLPRARQRIQLSRAKHRSLAGHARMAKRIASMIPGYAYDEAEFLSCDGAPQDVVARRRASLQRLSALYGERFARSAASTALARQTISDLQFTGSYRVPFQFSPHLKQHLQPGAVLTASRDVRVFDQDGNAFYDLTGSYGVNVFGTDFYKACIDDAVAQVRDLGPVLGAYHPLVLDILPRLREISGLDEVSFHMSGTEAVMQAVRLARYHTRRTHLVRFCGAYHGWWEDVQPGPGNPLPPRETYTLKDMDERSLKVLRTRDDIACVLVNPLQALHPNASAPADTALVDSSRRAGVDRQAYARWLQQLREVCTERGIVLIFDEIFVGFRLARRGAQEWFGVQADMVTYGKTLGGGLPVGVVCGKAALMKRFREDRPADVCLARGTFNAHPYVLGAMKAFLDRLAQPDVAAVYEGLDARWDGHARRFNERFEREGLPLRVAHLSSIWTVTYTQPSRYNWMLQYLLRAQGVALSWVGTGRLIFSLNYTDHDVEEVLERFVAAARQMVDAGWGWHDGQQPARAIKRHLLREMFSRRR